MHDKGGNERNSQDNRLLVDEIDINRANMRTNSDTDKVGKASGQEYKGSRSRL